MATAVTLIDGLIVIGGGITAENAKGFLDLGASHVIVTSYVFKDGRINYENLKKLETDGRKRTSCAGSELQKTKG